VLINVQGIEGMDETLKGIGFWGRKQHFLGHLRILRFFWYIMVESSINHLRQNIFGTSNLFKSVPKKRYSFSHGKQAQIETDL